MFCEDCEYASHCEHCKPRGCGTFKHCEGCAKECCEVPCGWLAYNEIVDYSQWELSELARELCEAVWDMNERQRERERIKRELIENWTELHWKDGELIVVKPNAIPLSGGDVL